MMLEMAKGLEWLHVTRKQIHRDIKPSNVLLVKNFQPKIADLGLVADSSKTYTNKAGTEHFMAPEIFAAQPYNTPVDIYALGALPHPLSSLCVLL